MEENQKVAWCTSMSPSDYDYFMKMKAAGVRAAVINLTLGLGCWNERAMDQMMAAKMAGMTISPFHLSIMDPFFVDEEMVTFSERLRFFDFDAGNVTLALMPTFKLTRARNTQLINQMVTALRATGDYTVDICVQAEDLADGRIAPEDLADPVNLTVINYDDDDAGYPGTGTWIYANEFAGQRQLLGVDFYQHYTALARPFDHANGVYIAQEGDSWRLVAFQHGMAVRDLLRMNSAHETDEIKPGQWINVA